MALSKLYPVADNLWAVDEIKSTTSFIYKGEEKVLLFDTGYGITDYVKLISGLCPGLPVVVVNSHAHGDHNGGNNQFDVTFCGRYDEPNSHHEFPPEARLQTIDRLIEEGSLSPNDDMTSWRPGPSKKVTPLVEGDAIDLGGIALQVIECPGHTMGSICLFDRANGYLFTGDLILTWEVWGQLGGSTALKYYAESLEKLAALEPMVGRVFPAHGKIDNPYGFNFYELPPRVLSIYARGTRAIVDGEAVGIPYRVGEGWTEGMCVYFEIGGMAYDPNRIGT